MREGGWGIAGYIGHLVELVYLPDAGMKCGLGLVIFSVGNKPVSLLRWSRS